jgi:hypothetical protein
MAPPTSDTRPDQPLRPTKPGQRSASVYITITGWSTS